MGESDPRAYEPDRLARAGVPVGETKVQVLAVVNGFVKKLRHMRVVEAVDDATACPVAHDQAEICLTMGHGVEGRNRPSAAVGFPGRRAGRVHTAGVGDSEPADDPHPATERPASGNRPRRGYWNGTVRRLASTSSVADTHCGAPHSCVSSPAENRPNASAAQRISDNANSLVRRARTNGDAEVGSRR